MQDPVSNIIDKIIQREGGYTFDQGGHTKYGITIPFFSVFLGRTATETDIRNLTADSAKAVYAKYFRQINIDSIKNENLLDLIFDFAVNAGEGKALKELQKAAGAAQDGKVGPATLAAIESKGYAQVYYALLQQRFLFWAELASKSPEKYLKSLPGWVNRGSQFIKNI